MRTVVSAVGLSVKADKGFLSPLPAGGNRLLRILYKPRLTLYVRCPMKVFFALLIASIFPVEAINTGAKGDALPGQSFADGAGQAVNKKNFIS